jgi:hypothetical protein
MARYHGATICSRVATMTEWLIDGPDSAPATVVLAHGAGAPMDSPFMNTVAEGLAARGLRVVRFEFPYMAQRREDGRKRPPNPQNVLLQAWRELVGELPTTGKRIIGGKALGGRMASLVAEELGVDGLVCLGYPFHPPGKPDRLRTEHLQTIRTPTLIVQGERDTFGRRDEVNGYSLADTIELAWMPDGDHSFKPRKRSGYTEGGNLEQAVEAVARFVERLR